MEGKRLGHYTSIAAVLRKGIDNEGCAEQPASQPATQNALALYDDNRNGRITCAEARIHGIAPVRRGHPAYPYMDDRDGDGIVCE